MQGFNYTVDNGPRRQLTPAFRVDANLVKQSATSGALNAFKQYEKNQARDATAEQLALNNARADETLKLQQAANTRAINADSRAAAQETDRVSALAQKAAQEKALAGIYDNMPDKQLVDKTVVTQKAIPGTVDNLAAVQNAQRANAMTALSQDALNSGRFSMPAVAPGKVLPSTIPTHPQSNALGDRVKPGVVLKQYPQVYGESPHTYYETADGEEMSLVGKWLGGYEEVDNFDRVNPLGTETNPVAPNVIREIDVVKSPAKSKEDTTKDDYIAKQLVALDKQLKKVPKRSVGTKGTAAQTKVVQEEIAMDREGRLQYLADTIRADKTLTGSAKINALKNLEVMVPETKSEKEAARKARIKWDAETQQQIKAKYASKTPTVSEQIAMQKYAAGLVDEATTVTELKNIHPKMPATIKTLKGAEAYIAKVSKKPKGSFNLAESMYSGLSGKDAEDTQAVTKFLKDNAKALSAMSAGEQKALVARYVAQYSTESGWDPTDFVGGSAAGDAFSY